MGVILLQRHAQSNITVSAVEGAGPSRTAMRSTVKCGIQRAGQLSSSLAVVLDGVPRLECQQAKPLPVTQLQYLDRLDRDMGAGIDLGGRRIESPNAPQRA